MRGENIEEKKQQLCMCLCLIISQQFVRHVRNICVCLCVHAKSGRKRRETHRLTWGHMGDKCVCRRATVTALWIEKNIYFKVTTA